MENTNKVIGSLFLTILLLVSFIFTACSGSDIPSSAENFTVASTTKASTTSSTSAKASQTTTAKQTTQIATTKSSAAAAKKQTSTSNRTAAQSTSSATSYKTAKVTGDDSIVYIAPKTGEKYHLRSQCDNGEYIAVTLREAKRRGHGELCKKCAEQVGR